MQGRSRSALGAGNAAYAGGPRKDIVARLIFLPLYCRTLNVEMLTVHSAVGNTVGPTSAACMGLKKVICRLVRRLDAPLKVGKEEVLDGSMGAD